MGLNDIRPVEDGWKQLDQRVVEISTWLATAFGCAMLAIGVASNQSDLAVLALNPFMIALAGWLMLAFNRPDVLLQLTVGLAALLVTTATSDLSEAHDPLLAVLAMTVVGVLFSRRRILPFVAISTLLVAMVAYLHEAALPVADRLQSALGAAMTVAFIAWLVSWVKNRWLESNQRLEDVITSKDQLVAAVSHELRTPMTSVVGLARELDERFDDFSEAEVREFLGLIVHESTDVANILEDLLVAARADVGNLALTVVAVDIYAEIAAAVNTTSSAQVNRHSPSGKLLVAADPMRVRQILRNLIVNATRYGGPAVRVTVGSDADFVAITVCDDGEPIPQAEREKIFLPYQGARGSTYVPGSVGLGLTVSRQLARLMGGDLSYDYLDAESRFKLVIPRHHEVLADDPASSRADAA